MEVFPLVFFEVDLLGVVTGFVGPLALVDRPACVALVFKVGFDSEECPALVVPRTVVDKVAGEGLAEGRGLFAAIAASTEETAAAVLATVTGPFEAAVFVVFSAFFVPACTGSTTASTTEARQKTD